MTDEPDVRFVPMTSDQAILLVNIAPTLYPSDGIRINNLTDAYHAAGKPSRWSSFTADELEFISSGGEALAVSPDRKAIEDALLREVDAEIERRRP